MLKFKNSIFIGGTSSGAGKSLIVTALCRILKQDGFNPAPFKAQNMSLNSYVTYDGLEMARAQVLQAEAAMIEPEIDMNPVLLKPFGDSMSQLIVRGKPQMNISSLELYEKYINMALEVEIYGSFYNLSKKYFPIIIEGAGSITELNLRKRDLANTRLARRLKSDVYIVSNIENGGVFASIYGSIELLPKPEKELVKGIIINKFRGDKTLFDDGIKILKRLTKREVLGVIPHINNLKLDEEDSLSLTNKRFIDAKVKIAVVRLPFISNFTDFTTLSMIEGVSLIFTVNPEDLNEADIIIIPGTKSTTKDMKFLWDSKLAECILEQYKKGKTIIGICGGYQIMGKRILDPEKSEGDIKSIKGLGILPIKTTLSKEKITKRVTFEFGDSKCFGYEIHSGRTEILKGTPFIKIVDGDYAGCKISDKIFGTYIHGFFDNRAVLEYILNRFDINLKSQLIYPEIKDRNINLLADKVRRNLNIRQIYTNLGIL